MAESFPKAFGKYRLLRKLAQGGMAEIFLAQTERGDICAIKRILPHLANEESFIRMFIDEARIVSHLDHPNIAAVYDQGKERGFYYIAMEFVQGHSLLALSEKAKATRMELPRGLLAFVVAELLAGLGCAHSARDAKGRHLGIVHRDVTPQNVLISYGGEVKLVDFGVAKARSRLTQTEAGFTKGKLAYMSPEQARGETLDGRSDLFSVGIILHEITTNGRLFNKEGPGGILGAIVNDPIPPPSVKVRGYPPDLERVVMRALEKDLTRRYQTAEEMRDELLRFARRERPPPSRQRLSELVHDLFGASESQSVIDRARELAAPTPERVEAHPASLVAGAEVRAPSAILEPDDEEAAARPDETRMMQAGIVDLRVRGASQAELTHARLAALEARAAAESEVYVPVPRAPLRVRLARFLRDLTLDLRVSFHEHRRRWLGGVAGGVTLFVVLVLGMSGAPSILASWAKAAAAAAREAKSSAGLGSSGLRDAGLLPTRLRIESEPPGATIIIDGIGMGAVTPHTLGSLPSGRPILLELQLAGYRTFRERILLEPFQGLREEAFTLERMVGALEVTSEPPGARIYLDGERIQETTPAVIESLLADRTTRVEARMAGRLSRSAAVLVPDGGRRSLHFDLPVDKDQIPNGQLSIESTPAGCPVFVDDVYAGVTPIAAFEARPGLRFVKVRCEHHEEEARSVTVMAGTSAKVSVLARPSVFGYLTIQAIPGEGTSVAINGREVRTPVRFLKVVPGRHVVAVRNSALNAEKQVTINVGPDERVHRSVSLIY